MKTFLYAGYSTNKRRTRVRYANDGSRVKTLERNEHTDINIFTLPYPMNKLEAVKWLIEGHFDGGDADLAQIFADELARLEKGEPASEAVDEVVADVEVVAEEVFA